MPLNQQTEFQLIEAMLVQAKQDGSLDRMLSQYRK